jgi:hypothetical protein
MKKTFATNLNKRSLGKIFKKYFEERKGKK